MESGIFSIERYTSERADLWNGFIQSSKNGTFLLERPYMDYHHDRFRDASLLFFMNGELYAVLPGNVRDGVYYSHLGLTYGSMILSQKATAAEVVVLFKQLGGYLKETLHVDKVIYKAIPWIYHRLPAEEDLYALFRMDGVRLMGCDISSVIDLKAPVKWRRDRRAGVKKAQKSGVTVLREAGRLEDFWQVLDENLGRKFHVAPVHSLQEMSLLMSRFPENVVLYTAVYEEKVIGGVLLYKTGRTVHSQYISASPLGKRLGAVDAIMEVVLAQECSESEYFDFGKSTERHGDVLNETLIYQKEGFGGRGVCYNTYVWQL